ncbi:Copper-bind domain containing protein [Dokdonella koreensis DS-123]|uniref:Copper-bind domain containing protein n=2 Tax=Dokdonella TaxID=323413 RepID=A0A160DWY5_9GAMM|nr:Copper-bind domain containing protein [Dokdonella koreensis DS-123]
MRRYPLLMTGAFALAAAAPAFAGNHTVTARPNMTFDPPSLTIAAGDTVTFVNGGGFHNVESDPDAVTPFHCSTACGASPIGDPSSAIWQATVTFPDAGTARYFCSQHGGPGGVGMAGMIIVKASDVIFASDFENPPGT